MQQPNAKCACGSGKKFKKCCYLKELVGKTCQPEVAETPLDPEQEEAEFQRLLAWWVQKQKDPDFVEFMHEEKDAAAWALTDEGIEITPYPAHIQQMREKERKRETAVA